MRRWVRVLEADLVGEGSFVGLCGLGCGGGERQGADLADGRRRSVVERRFLVRWRGR
jgi:hypothetical protein